MHREILFRGYDDENKCWRFGSLLQSEIDTNVLSVRCQIHERFGDDFSVRVWNVVPESVGMFIGHKISETKVFDGDIVREEIENDNGDEMAYFVVTWIKEWCMFAVLSADEYFSYKLKGAEALDETMFWTFPIEEKDNVVRKICGNVFDNPNLLTP